MFWDRQVLNLSCQKKKKSLELGHLGLLPHLFLAYCFVGLKETEIFEHCASYGDQSVSESAAMNPRNRVWLEFCCKRQN